MKPSMGKLSASEKEKTKMRERTRRSITTKIFQGLRKYGGYNLAPRADINEVLRCLAAEAGWTVEEDGTTYRSAQAPVGQGAFRQFPGVGVAFPGGSLSGLSGLMGSESGGGSLSGGGASILGGAAGGGGGALMGGPGGVFNSATGGLVAVGNGIFSLQALDNTGSFYLDSRGGGDCSTTASPRHGQGGAPAAATNCSNSLFSPHNPTAYTPPDHVASISAAMSFCMPSAASPAASSNVYPSSSRSTNTQLAPLPLPSTSPTPAAQIFPPSFPSCSYAGASSYYVNLPSGIARGNAELPLQKDDLLDAATMPLDYNCQQRQNQLLAVATLAARAGQYGAQQEQLLGSVQQDDQRPASTIFSSGVRLANIAASTRSTAPSFPALMMQLSQQQVQYPFMQEARASNHNTPLGSPQHHG